MTRRTNIDRSLTERQVITSLLSRVEEETITADEMEDIGTRLQKSGQSALSPLVRRLWREKKGDLISRYAYLLDFFEDEVWLDQLIQMALRRKDLEDEGKAALLTALEGFGVDVSAPHFAKLFPPGGGSLELMLPGLLDRGDEGLVIFIDDLLFQSAADRAAILRALPGSEDPRLLPLFELLLGIEEPELIGEVIGALGRFRSAAAATLLEKALPHLGPAQARLAHRSLRRLAFLGISADGSSLAKPPLPFLAACASPVDGAGYRVLWFARPLDTGAIVVTYLQLHEGHGLHSVWGASNLTPAECEEHQAALSCEEGTVDVAPDYALLLLRDALYQSRERDVLFPADFYVWRRYFTAEEVTPLPYLPRFAGRDQRRHAVAQRHVAAGGELFDDDYFAGWVMVNHRVYDFAEELLGLEETGKMQHLPQKVEALIRRFCDELLEPEKDRIKRRLLLIADFMEQTGRERDLVEKTVAIAHSLDGSTPAAHCHPFLRRFALESIDMAREGLAEGYDLRQQADEDDDECE